MEYNIFSYGKYAYDELIILKDKWIKPSDHQYTITDAAIYMIFFELLYFNIDIFLICSMIHMVFTRNYNMGYNLSIIWGTYTMLKYVGEFMSYIFMGGEGGIWKYIAKIFLLKIISNIIYEINKIKTNNGSTDLTKQIESIYGNHKEKLEYIVDKIMASMVSFHISLNSIINFVKDICIEYVTDRFK